MKRNLIIVLALILSAVTAWAEQLVVETNNVTLVLAVTK